MPQPRSINVDATSRHVGQPAHDVRIEQEVQRPIEQRERRSLPCAGQRRALRQLLSPLDVRGRQRP